jgi:hypothetical protein
MRTLNILPSLLLVGSMVLLSDCKDDPENSVSGFQVANNFLAEGNSSGTRLFQLQVKGTLHTPITIQYEVKEATARFGHDLTAASGELTLSPNQAFVEVPIEIIGDEFLELTEYFELVVSFEGKEYPIAVNIEDDDFIEAIQEDEDGYYTVPEHPSMQLKWSDEFNGTELNTAYWTYEIGNGCSIGLCGWGNNELQSYTSDVASINLDEGRLHIVARHNSGNYTSARIKTQQKTNFQFGRIDVRARLPKGKGIWPAIWMLGENITTAGWPACGEIDIMELVGHQPAQVHGTVHYDNGGYKSVSGSTSLTSGDFSDKFHVFSIVWDMNKITWYVDNKTYAIFNADVSTFNRSFFFIMNVAVGGNWPGSPDDTTVFPQEMLVDYIRVFQ